MRNVYTSTISKQMINFFSIISFYFSNYTTTNALMSSNTNTYSNVNYDYGVTGYVTEEEMHDVTVLSILVIQKEKIIGSDRIPVERFNEARYIIELDRKNVKDLIQNSGRTRLCSNTFVKLWEGLGYEKNQGTFTDLNNLKLKAPKIEMCNLSIGYYNPHTKDEYLYIQEFEYTKEAVRKFIEMYHEIDFEDIEAI